MTTDIWLVVLKTIVMRLPDFAIGTAGLWFAIARRREHPRVSAFGMVGFGALLASAMLFLGMQLWIQFALAEGSALQASGIVSRWNLVGYPLNLISLTAIGVAVFIDRRPPAGSIQSNELSGAA